VAEAEGERGVGDKGRRGKGKSPKERPKGSRKKDQEKSRAAIEARTFFLVPYCLLTLGVPLDLFLVPFPLFSEAA
jgi:hypothetical protein